MKSAGKFASRSSPANGWWICAKGIAPLSYQTSITSGSRRMTPSHSPQVSSTSSTKGRWGSKSSPGGSVARWRSSSKEPTMVVASHPEQRQMGSGVPQ